MSDQAALSQMGQLRKRGGRSLPEPTEAQSALVRDFLARDPVDRWRGMLRVAGSWARAYVWRLARAGRVDEEIRAALEAEGLTPCPEWAEVELAVLDGWRNPAAWGE